MSNTINLTKEAQPEEDPSVSARLQRLQNNYEDFGMRRTVEGILVVHDHGHPHILMLQIANAFFKLPGDYLKPGEDESEGLKARLDERLAPLPGSSQHLGQDGDWEIGDCLAQWWRPNFETFMVLAVPKNMKLLAIPLFELYDNAARYGPQLSAIPHLLSRWVWGVSGGRGLMRVIGTTLSISEVCMYIGEWIEWACCDEMGRAVRGEIKWLISDDDDDIPSLKSGFTLIHLKVVLSRQRRSLYTAVGHVPFDYAHSPRPSARKVPQSSHQSEQPPGSPATTLPTYGPSPVPWLCNWTPYSPCALDATWFPLALGIDIPLRPKEKPDAWRFECGAFGIPKKGKPASSEDLGLAVQVGEDSYFDALGVADGVGGWAHHRVHADSARFARMLMHHCASEIATEALCVPDHSPRDILHLAYERTVASFRATGTAGSSTALVAVLRDGELSVAHLGDCMLAVVRDGRFVVRSEDMQHSFNFPYQLGPHSSTTPRADAQLITEKVVPGDIVILASDGLGDNLWDDEVLAEVERFVAGARAGDVEAEPLGNPQVLGEALARRAKRAAEGTKDVPFGVRGRAAGIQFMGGKTDGQSHILYRLALIPADISVVVAVVRGPAS
ncbi:Protein phosphatase PTC7 [Ceratobasidium theobromae]|uniref:Protein phosphatase n=1 Tax=Ceratobasidium theobromae TaxID=1582974 RepID=A0A5N5QAJ9_9AGAM|nr:Protein phosphatase PTC7 [Ceratobasidium theobromae]